MTRGADLATAAEVCGDLGAEMEHHLGSCPGWGEAPIRGHARRKIEAARKHVADAAILFRDAEAIYLEETP